MNIYELEKQATPGPWRKSRGEFPTIVTGKHCIGHFYGTNESVCIDTRLAAHCRNNFMRALEALKKANRTLTMYHGDGSVGPFDATIYELV